MDTKYCNGCKKELPVSEFGKESRAKNGYKPRCKECSNAYYREFYANNDYKYRKSRVSKIRYQKNKDEISEKRKKWYSENREKILGYSKQYRKENHKKIIENNKIYIREKRKSCSEFKANLFMRKQVHRCLENKKDRTHKLLRYTKKELLDWLGGEIPEDQSVDHKIPVSWFDKDTPVHIINHLHNLQLMQKNLNFQKNNTYADKVSKEYYNICIGHIKDQHKDKVSYE